MYFQRDLPNFQISCNFQPFCLLFLCLQVLITKSEIKKKKKLFRERGTAKMGKRQEENTPPNMEKKIGRGSVHMGHHIRCNKCTDNITVH
jgi:hypothetical protein